MIDLIEPQTKNLKIIHLEDDHVTQRIVSDFIRIHYSNIELIQNESGISVCTDMPFEKPDVIIVDWMLKDCCADQLLNTLRRHKGLVIFFSSMNTQFIRRAIVSEFGYMPLNFIIMQKTEDKAYQKLLKEIASYARKIKKNV